MALADAGDFGAHPVTGPALVTRVPDRAPGAVSTPTARPWPATAAASAGSGTAPLVTTAPVVPPTSGQTRCAPRTGTCWATATAGRPSGRVACAAPRPAASS